MKIITSPQEMQEWSLKRRAEGETIAFVPTMGALHEGHLSLLHEGLKLADHLVLSIFVNPAQFGPKEDLNRYPQDFEGDLKKISRLNVSVVFHPSAQEIYSQGFQTFVEVEALSNLLCGENRPGHFRGVATVVLKLFNIIQPHLALFGEKDFQQLRIIQQMVKDLNLPVQIKPMPIVREADGLAMSSRNRYLSKEERESALAISHSLKKAEALVQNGCSDLHEIRNMVCATLAETKKIRINYVTLSDPETLQELKTFKTPLLLAIACLVRKTRLIDNCLLR